MIAILKMAKLMHHSIFQHRLRREDQSPVQMNSTCRSTTSPVMFKFFDSHLARDHIQSPGIGSNERINILTHTIFQPDDKRMLDLSLTAYSRMLDDESVAI